MQEKMIKEKGMYRSAVRRNVMKNVLMPQYLFAVLYKCMVLDLPGKCENCSGCEKIKKWLEEKGNKIYENEQYRKAKLSADPEEREAAFRTYVELKKERQERE